MAEKDNLMIFFWGRQSMSAMIHQSLGQLSNQKWLIEVLLATQPGRLAVCVLGSAPLESNQLPPATHCSLYPAFSVLRLSFCAQLSSHFLTGTSVSRQDTEWIFQGKIPCTGGQRHPVFFPLSWKISLIFAAAKIHITFLPLPNTHYTKDMLHKICPKQS